MWELIKHRALEPFDLECDEWLPCTALPMETSLNKNPIKSLTAEQVQAVRGFLPLVTGSAECWLYSDAGSTESLNKGGKK